MKFSLTNPLSPSAKSSYEGDADDSNDKDADDVGVFQWCLPKKRPLGRLQQDSLTLLVCNVGPHNGVHGV